MTVDVQCLLGADGAIARALDGYEPRPQQLAMASAVDDALAAGRTLLVEAGTGVGKSFAYLLPALKRVIEHGERVVISTHTINLQEQIIGRDVPLLRAVLGEPFKAVLVKGRGNYVSLRRLERASALQQRLFPGTSERRALHAIEDWAIDSRDGSRQSLPVVPPGAVWDAVRSDSGNCMGRKCPRYEKCFYQAARRRMESGDLLVCNHALLFADLALRLRGTSVLPPYKHVILDEAHAVEDVAADHFGFTLAETRIDHFLGVLWDPRRQRGFLASMLHGPEAARIVEETVEAVNACAEASRRFFDDLLDWSRRSGIANARIPGPGIVENGITPAFEALRNRLRLLREHATEEADRYEIAGYAVRAEEIATEAAVLIEQTADGCVYFVEHVERGRPPRRVVTLRAMVVDVGPLLREHLFLADGEERSGRGVVLTSATLATTPGDFSLIRQRLGCEESDTLELGSPFQHARQMRVFVDDTMPDPKDPRYVDELVPRVEQLVARTDGGAFVLFTSFAMLRAAARALRDPLEARGHPVLVQGEDGPPGTLLERFRDDRRSVLFGTASFWQGVDVRGEGLRNVIITRLPFEVPDHPVVEARHQRLRDAGKHPFMADQVPRAVLRFRQGIGRLIRSGSDHGVVAVLDPRIVTKGYGRAFRAALPDEIEVERMAEVEREEGTKGGREEAEGWDAG